MKTEFVDYLKEIQLSATLINRIETIHEFCGTVCPEGLDNIFVTDFIKEDGSREYENAWFFSPGYVMEAKGFLAQDEFDMTPISKRVVYWSIKKQDYDFIKATEQSRLHIEATLDVKMAIRMKASRNNCDYLKEIFKKYILANLKQ